MSDAGLDAIIIAQGDIPMSFLGAPVNVQISIASRCLTEMSWSLFGRPYLFSITYWRSGSINKMAKQFLE